MYKRKENCAKCCYCLAEITPDNEKLPRIDYRETEILNLKQQIQNLQNVISSLRQQRYESVIYIKFKYDFFLIKNNFSENLNYKKKNL